jgi:hypothetical protein
VHWKCNPAKEKQAYTGEKGGPRGNLLRQNYSSLDLARVCPLILLPLFLPESIGHCPGQIGQEISHTITVCGQVPLRREAEIPAKATSKKGRTIWHFPRLLTTP